MRTIKQSGQFKREAKGTYRAALTKDFTEIIRMLANDEPLAAKHRDHALTSNWKDYRDCHIKPDLILIYGKGSDDILELVRLGSHSELGL